MKTYSSMKDRVSGVISGKAHLYKGLPILPRGKFYLWSKNNEDFLRLYQSYVESQFDMKKAPSIDRIDPRGGYTLENMRWITHSHNSSLGSINRHKKT